MSTPESDAYDYAIAEVTKAYQDAPNGEDLLAKIAENFEKQFTNPPNRIFETLIGNFFTADEVRCVLFRPTEEQARLAMAYLLLSKILKSLMLYNTLL